MIGIVIVSHSYHLGAEVIKIAEDMFSPSKIKFPMLNASGLEDRSLGTSPERIYRCIKKANSGRGVIIICDLGSSVYNSLEAIKLLDNHDRKKVFIADAPLVEGSIVASSANCKKSDLKCLLNEIQEVKKFSKLRS